MVKTYCDKYYEQVVRAGDYNILGQALKVLCQLEKTNFKDDESIKDLGFVARDAGELIKHFGEELLKGVFSREKLEKVS